MSITDKTHVVKTYDGIEIWINEVRAKKLGNALNDSIVVEIDGNYISSKNISGVYTARDFNNSQNRKAGTYFDKEATRKELEKLK